MQKKLQMEPTNTDDLVEQMTYMDSAQKVRRDNFQNTDGHKLNSIL